MLCTRDSWSGCTSWITSSLEGKAARMTKIISDHCARHVTTTRPHMMAAVDRVGGMQISESGRVRPPWVVLHHATAKSGRGAILSARLNLVAAGVLATGQDLVHQVALQDKQERCL